MLTDDIIVTRNEALSADTYNVDVCNYQSPWCTQHCYGRKLYGHAYVARRWTPVIRDGNIVRHRGPAPYLRPFTVAGDIPSGRQERMFFRNTGKEVFPRYKSVWIPTRSWSTERGLETLALVLDTFENVAVTLSFDGSMDVRALMDRVSRLHRYTARISLGAVIDTVGKAAYTVAEQERVDALRAIGLVECPKTFGAGTCHTCGRLCWAERRDGKTSAIGVPIIGYKYHR